MAGPQLIREGELAAGRPGLPERFSATDKEMQPRPQGPRKVSAWPREFQPGNTAQSALKFAARFLFNRDN